MPKKSIKNVGGRPSVMTEKVIAELKGAFAVGATDSQACFYAEIDESTFYRYCEKTEGFREEMNRLKEKPILKAKTNIVTKLLGGDTEVSKWYLERRARAEFATRQEIGNSDGVPFQLIIKDYGGIDTDEATEDSVEPPA